LIKAENEVGRGEHKDERLPLPDVQWCRIGDKFEFGGVFEDVICTGA